MDREFQEAKLTEYHGQLTPPAPVRIEIRNPTDMPSFLQRLDAKEQAYRRFEIDSTTPTKEVQK